MKRNKGFQMVRKRIPYSTTGIDYQNMLSIVEKSEDFEKIIDKKISQFKRQGLNISASSEYFENIINRHTASLLARSEQEHINNMHSIGYLFRKRASDRIELQDLLDRLDEEIASTEIEYEAIKKIAEEMNPLKNGRLAAEEIIHTTHKEEKTDE